MEEIVFPNKIRMVRKSRGYSMQSLANVLGISLSAVSKIEKGYRHIKQEQVLKILEFLNCSVDDILLSDHEDVSILDDWKEKGEKRISDNEKNGLKVFGAGIRYLRAKTGKTLSELANSVGLTISVYHKIEVGQRDIYENEFSLICKALNVPKNMLVKTIAGLAKSGALDKYLKANKTSFKILNSSDIINRSVQSGLYKIPLYGSDSDNGNILIDRKTSDLINCPNHDPSYSWCNMYALRLCNRRLGSTFPDNTILYVHTSSPVHAGDIAVYKVISDDGRVEAKVMVIREKAKGQFYGVLKNPNEELHLSKDEFESLEKVVFISVA